MNRPKVNKFIFGAMYRLKIEESDRFAIVKEVTGVEKGFSDCTDNELEQVKKWFENALNTPSKREQFKQKQAQSNDPKRAMIRKLISVAYTLQWAKPGDWRKALADIDAFCRSKKGVFSKPLDDHNVADLTHLVTQFKEMEKKHYKEVGR